MKQHNAEGKNAILTRLLRDRKLRWIEGTILLLILIAYIALPAYHTLLSQIFIFTLFVLSLDLLVGYAGLVTLGHAAFFGVGAYSAGLYAIHISSEPLSGLIVATCTAALIGLVSGALILRTTGLTFLMLTLAVASVIHEALNQAGELTGGADGLRGIEMAPLLGIAEFDFMGQTAFIYSASILVIGYLLFKQIIVSPFGRQIVGIRENAVRMRAIGSPVYLRLLVAYTISAGMAGTAGALLAQTNQFVSLSVVTMERSGEALIMLIFGGAGKLFGAFVGVPIYMLLQDSLSRYMPIFWIFWIGLMLVLIVKFAKNGVLGVSTRLLTKYRSRHG